MSAMSTMNTEKVKGVQFDKANGVWIHRATIDSKRVKTILGRADYPDGQVPSRPPEDFLRLIPGYAAKEEKPLVIQACKGTPNTSGTPLSIFVGDWLAKANVVGRSSKGRTTAVAHFLEFCGAMNLTRLEDVKVKEMKAFVDFLRDKGNLDSTINTRISFLSRLFSDSIENGDYIGANPVRYARKKLKVSTEYSVNPYTDAEVVALLDAIKADIAIGVAPPWLLDATLIMFCGGLRACEAIGLDTSWVNLKTNTITIPAAFSKGKKSHIAPLTPEVREIILRVMKVAPGKVLPITNSDQSYQALKKVIERHGLKDEGHYNHILRHSMATSALNREEPIGMDWLQQALGHASQTMTQRYAKMSTTTLGKAFEGFGVPKVPSVPSVPAVASK